MPVIQYDCAYCERHEIAILTDDELENTQDHIANGVHLICWICYITLREEM